MIKPGDLVEVMRQRITKLWREPSDGALDIVGTVATGEVGLVIAFIETSEIRYCLCLFPNFVMGWIYSGWVNAVVNAE